MLHTPPGSSRPMEMEGTGQHWAIGPGANCKCWPQPPPALAMLTCQRVRSPWPSPLPSCLAPEGEVRASEEVITPIEETKGPRPSLLYCTTGAELGAHASPVGTPQWGISRVARGKGKGEVLFARDSPTWSEHCHHLLFSLFSWDGPQSPVFSFLYFPEAPPWDPGGPQMPIDRSVRCPSPVFLVGVGEGTRNP